MCEKGELLIKEEVQFRTLCKDESDNIGNFIKKGKLAWTASGSNLEVISTENGNIIAHCNFSKCHKTKNCVITCVEEIHHMPSVCILAITIEFYAGAGGMVCIFIVQGSKILGSLDFCNKITSCHEISSVACNRSVMKQFSGCLAIGTDQGKIYLIDLQLPSTVQEIANSPSKDSELSVVNNVPANMDQREISLRHKQLAQENAYFSIELEVLADSGPVLSILCLPSSFTLAVGLYDGRLVLYDLKDLQAFHLAHPPENSKLEQSPLTFMSSLEPTDDPRACCYIWAYHASPDGAIAVMHSLMFESKINSVFENFITCCARLTMPMYDKSSFPVCCRSIRKIVSQDEEDILTLNLLCWNSKSRQETTTILLFDINQWYKEEMPSVGDWRMFPNYLTAFTLNNSVSLDILLHEQTLFSFNSIQRPEEHFYPNSLTFEVTSLEALKCTHYSWPGIQNIMLESFSKASAPQMILEPTLHFNEMLRVALYPQFYDINFNINTSNDVKREFLLSVALEYNFVGFLRRCASSWADGSYMGKDALGLSLSTLTEWIWKRAKALKNTCNELCQPLFDFSERRIDYGTQKTLSHCSKQLKSLTELMEIILRTHKQYIPENVMEMLSGQSREIKLVSEYQEVLQWLLNVGLLPEGIWRPESRLNDEPSFTEEEFVIVPYPYCLINSYYMTQRMKFADEDYSNMLDKNCRYLFIDTFIEQECNPDAIKKLWKENGGNGLYPPSSIQTLLRTLLIPDISIENKYILFVYLFMDINSILNEGNKGRYSSIVQNLIKFPAVFKLNPAIIKRTQAFWNLDNGRWETAIDELISPLSHEKRIKSWQREFLLTALLKQNANNLALRALRSPGNAISPMLEIKTLLANNLVAEALRAQRVSGDHELLELLFEKIITSSKHEMLLDLALSDEECLVLTKYLSQLDLTSSVNLHFVFLLQRSKFIDAVSLIDQIARHKNSRQFNLEPPKEVLSVYHGTMEPTTRHLVYMTYTDKESYQHKPIESPQPLSGDLIRSKMNAKNNIYQRTIQTISEAADGSAQELPFISKQRIYGNHQPEPRDLVYPYVISDGKRRISDQQNQKEKDAPSEFSLFEDVLAPNKKRRKLNETTAPTKSFKDKNMSMLTSFRDTKPNINFTRKTFGSKHTTPEKEPSRLLQQLHALSTPVIRKRSDLTPEKRDYRAVTPHSILKSTKSSLRGSVSPTPSRMSRMSEFEDNKSVKSITFAFPDSGESSELDDTINVNEQSATDLANQSVSSSDAFYSPENSFVIPNSGLAVSTISPVGNNPLARPALRSRSSTPVDEPTTSRPKVNIFTTPNPDVLKPQSPANSSKFFQFRQEYGQSPVVSEQPQEAPAIVPEIVQEPQMSLAASKYFQFQQDYEPVQPEKQAPEPPKDQEMPAETQKFFNLPQDHVKSQPEPSKVVIPTTPTLCIPEIKISECGPNFREESKNMSDSADSDPSPPFSPIGPKRIFRDASDSSSFSDTSNVDESMMQRVAQVHQGPILRPDFGESSASSDESSSNSLNAIPDLRQKPILGPEFDDEDENIMPEKQENLPDESSNNSSEKNDDDEFEYGDVNLNDTEESEAESESDRDQDNRSDASSSSSDVIEILSSSEEESENFKDVKHIKQEALSPVALPNISSIQTTTSAQFTSTYKKKSFIELEAVRKSDNTVNTVFSPNSSDEITTENSPVKLSEPSAYSLIYEDLDEHVGTINQGIVKENFELETPIVEYPKLSFIEPKVQSQDEIPIPTEQIEIVEKTDEIMKPTTSERSSLVDESVEESFTSAVNDDLNEAVIFSQTPSVGNLTTISDTNTTSDDQNVLNIAISQTISEEIMDQAEEIQVEPIAENQVVEEEISEEPTNIFEVAQIVESTVSIDKEPSFIEDPDEDYIVVPQPKEKVEETVEITKPAIEISEPIAGPSSASTQTFIPSYTPIKTRSRMARAKSVETSTLAKPIVNETEKSTEEVENVPATKSRTIRAKSVPKLGSSALIKKRRVSSDDPHNPKNLLKEKILEKISESEEIKVLSRSNSMHSLHDEPLLTPKKLTRKSISVASIASSGGSAVSSKSTKSRRQSTGTPEVLTPRRLTRAASKEQLTPVQEEQKTKKRVRTVSFSDDEDAKSEISAKSTRSSRKTQKIEKDPVLILKKSTQKAKTSLSSNEESPEASGEISSSSRRMTRNQMAVMEKSRVLSEKFAKEAKKKATGRGVRMSVSTESLDQVGEESDDDKASVKSVKSSKSTTSKASKKRGRPKKNKEDDAKIVTEEIVESPDKKHMLSIIPEENEDSINRTLQRTRARKSKD